MKPRKRFSKHRRPAKPGRSSIADSIKDDEVKTNNAHLVSRYLQDEWWLRPPTLSVDELCKYCWKCAERKLSDEAEKEYSRIVKGRVQAKLRTIVKRWLRDKHIMAYLSIFGKQFDIIMERK